MLQIWDYIRHLDEHIAEMIKNYGAWSYGILFGIVFAETGFVITPFLPGDTLLFAAGLFSRPETADHTGGLNIWLTLAVLTAAPLCGDNINYFFGKWLGPRLFKNENSKIFRKSYLDRTHAFFEKHGAKTIILARWVPIVRTFAPFVAGMGAMPYLQFLRNSIIGAILWVWLLVSAGYFFGGLPWVRDNFELAMVAMIFITAGPVAFEVIKSRYHAKKEAKEPAAAVDSH